MRHCVAWRSATVSVSVRCSNQRSLPHGIAANLWRRQPTNAVIYVTVCSQSTSLSFCYFMTVCSQSTSLSLCYFMTVCSQSTSLSLCYFMTVCSQSTSLSLCYFMTVCSQSTSLSLCCCGAARLGRPKWPPLFGISRGQLFAAFRLAEVARVVGSSELSILHPPRSRETGRCHRYSSWRRTAARRS